MAEELSGYGVGGRVQSSQRVIREHTGSLSLAVIMDRLNEAKGRGVDAAWELAVRSRIWDDEITLVIPQAILHAWPSALWNAGDKTGARMAFKNAYPEYLAVCGEEVFVSLGWDPEGRHSGHRGSTR